MSLSKAQHEIDTAANRLLADYTTRVSRMRTLQKASTPTMTRSDRARLVSAETEVDELTTMFLLPPLPEPLPSSGQAPTSADSAEASAEVEEDELLRLDDEHAQLRALLTRIIDAWYAIAPAGWVQTKAGSPHDLVHAIQSGKALLERIEVGRSG